MTPDWMSGKVHRRKHPTTPKDVAEIFHQDGKDLSLTNLNSFASDSDNALDEDIVLKPRLFHNPHLADGRLLCLPAVATCGLHIEMMRI